MNRRTDIAVTIGPASESIQIMEGLILAGATVFRFPFAREHYDINIERTVRLRQVAKRLGKKVYVMQDVPGRKLRLATREEIPVRVGERITMGVGSRQGHCKHCSLDSAWVPFDAILEGTSVYFGDGEVEALVCGHLDAETLICEIINDGVIQGFRGVTFQGHFSFERSLSDRDRNLLKQATSIQYDYVALSFVQSPEEVQEARKLLAVNNSVHTKIIAKIETNRGIENLETILAASDGVIVARGDLAIQSAYDRLPSLQRHILKLARAVGSYSIVATHMIESVETRRVPNRSEIIDVANAVYQGASAVMCSGETRTGQQPIYTVEVLDRIVRQAERDIQLDSNSMN
jgi:pyruvate kinase